MRTDDISISLGSFRRKSPLEAAELAVGGLEVPVLGHLGASVIQICPQNRGQLDKQALDAIQARFPGHEIRFHANVELEEFKRLYDVIDFDPQHPYWALLKQGIKQVGSPVYSAHAGYRKGLGMNDLFDRQRALMDFLGVPVALEGHYPTRNDRFLASTWAEWEMILESGLPFVVDLSHAAIIARHEQTRNEELLAAMMESQNCLEIHISGNNELADQHTPLTGREWWWDLFGNRNSQSPVFYEGCF